MHVDLLAYLPIPPTNGFNIGPLRVHIYGIIIAIGVVAGTWLAQRRWQSRGGQEGTIARLAVWGVPAGIIGARIYSVITSWQADTAGQWYRAFEIWDGGLGIWGGVAAGVPVGLLAARHYHVDWRSVIDACAPALILAQAIGRWGNYFNQELYGGPTHLPWAVTIARPVHCFSVTACVPYPPGVHTFQPAFLYESVWDLACVAFLILAERHFRIRKGYLFFLYASLYTFGRFFVEYIRVDEAHRYLGLRLNDWSSILVFTVCTTVLLLRGRASPGKPTTLDPVTPSHEPVGGEEPVSP